MTEIVSGGPGRSATAADRPPVRWAEVALGVGLNFIPIFGVLFWGWSPFALIFLYWLENVVIGARSLASMLVSGFAHGGPVGAVGAGALGAFFTVHYGMFCFVHGTLVVALFKDAPGVGVVNSPFDLLGAAKALFASQGNLVVGLASILLWQAAIFVLFLMRGEAAKTTPSKIMNAPYGRIIILHVTIIFGGFLLMSLGWPIAGVVLLGLFKTLADVWPALGLDVKPKKRAA